MLSLGEAGLIDLIVGPQVLHEVQNVVARKVPSSLPDLALLLSNSRVVVAQVDWRETIEKARKLVKYLPDARVLGEALGVEPDWFITHDQEHFLKIKEVSLNFRLGTPGDLIQQLRENLLIS